jgi:hypothetical protein
MQRNHKGNIRGTPMGVGVGVPDFDENQEFAKNVRFKLRMIEKWEADAVWSVMI